MLNKKEILRQLVHFSGVLVVFIPKSWDLVMVGSILLTLSLVGFIAANMLKTHQKKGNMLTKAAADRTMKIINLAEREKAFTFKGAIMFFVGIGITLILFPRDIALLSVLALAVGDSASTLVGIHLGSHKIKFNRKKSWEGTFAGFAGIVIFGALAQFRADMVLTTAVIGMAAELFVKKFDDNIAIPLTTGTVLFLLRNVFGLI